MRGLITIAAMLLSALCMAQVLPQSQQYFINPVVISPAFTGHNTNYEAFIGYQRSWLGVDGAPELKLFNLNGPLGEKMGIGGGIMDDQAGIFRSLHLYLNYAYHLTLKEDMQLSFGANAGLIDQQLTLGPLVSDPGVNALRTAQKKHFNAGIGINYRWKDLNAGVTVPYLLESKTSVSDSSNSAQHVLSRQYRMYGRYDIHVQSDWTISPIVLVNMTTASYTADISALVNYKELVWLGLGYQSSGTIGMTLGGLPTRFLSVQYSYGIGGSGVLAQSSGNHEISIGLLIGSNESSSTSIFKRPAGEKKKSYYKWMDF